MEYGHATVGRELPQILGAAADADLYGARGVEHAVEDGEAKRAAVMEFGALVLAGRIAMGVDVDEADRLSLADGTQYGKRDRVVAADGEGNYAGLDERAVVGLDIGVALVEREAALHRHVADVGKAHMRGGGDFEGMLIGPDALHGADGTRAEAGAGAVGDAQVHRHPDQGDVEVGKSTGGSLRAVGGAEQGRDVGERPLAAVGRCEHGRGDRGEVGIVDVAALGRRIFQAQGVELGLVHGAGSGGGRRTI